MESGVLRPRTEAGARGPEKASRPEPVLTLFDGESVEQVESVADARSRLGDSGLLWIDLAAAAEDDIRHVTDELELDEESARRLSSPGVSSPFRDAGRFVHVTIRAPDRDAPDGVLEIECVVGLHCVVTAHDDRVAVLEDFTELVSGTGPTGELDGPGFLAALLDWVLHEYHLAFERLEEELEDFDTRAMRGRGRPEDEIDSIVELRARCGRLRRSLTTHRGPLLALTHPELEALGDPDSARRFELLLQRYESTLQSARDARESIVSSFDVLIARTGHRTNEIVKLLTLVSVIFLPGALLAGVMGMNFKVGLFDHAGGFWLVLAAIAAIGVTTLAVAKLREWI